MVQHYSPKTFLRQTSNAILQACFEKQGALKDVPWNGLPEHQIDVVYDQWQDLPESQRLTFERLFEDAEELANDDGLKILIEEGQFHKLDLATELGQFPNYRDKALYVSLNYPRVFEVAGTIHHAHSLPQRYWRRRGGMPLQQPDVTPAGIGRFRDAIPLAPYRPGPAEDADLRHLCFRIPATSRANARSCVSFPRNT